MKKERNIDEFRSFYAVKTALNNVVTVASLI